MTVVQQQQSESLWYRAVRVCNVALPYTPRRDGLSKSSVTLNSVSVKVDAMSTVMWISNPYVGAPVVREF